MGFLDQLWGDARNAAGQQEGKLPALLLSELGGGQGQADQANGLTALISKFQQAGLGSVVESWVSNDTPNQPVSPDQVRTALGDGPVQAVAKQTGLPTTAVLAALAAILPKLVDSVTPNGQVPNPPDRSVLRDSGQGAAEVPDQEPGEAEAPPSTQTGPAGEAVNSVDPTEPTQAADPSGARQG